MLDLLLSFVCSSLWPLLCTPVWGLDESSPLAHHDQWEQANGGGLSGDRAGCREGERGEGLQWADMAVCQDTLMCHAVLFQQLSGEGKLFAVRFHPTRVLRGGV